MPRSIWLLLLLGLGVRLIGVGAPLIGMHSWRQADTAAMARNYHENGYRLLSPQVDWGGSGPGYVESEFPIYSYATALLYGVFGVHEALGRILAALGFVLGAMGLFHLVRAAVDQPTAVWSTAFFLFLPLNVFYGRAFMPEAWMIGASVAGVLFFRRWTLSGRRLDLVLSALFVSIAAWIKLPALYLGLPIAYLAWLRFRGRLLAQPALWTYALAVVIAVGAWYAHAHSIRSAGGLTFGIWEYGSDKWGNWSLVASPSFWNGILFRSLAERWFTWAGFALFLVGLFLHRRSETERLFDVWLVALLVYVVIVARGNYVHEYYQLPFMPVGAVYMGKVFARYWCPGERRAATAVLSVALLALAVLSASRLRGYLQKEDASRSAELAIGALVKNHTAANALIVTPTGGNPTLLYLSHRKGWTVPERELTQAYMLARRDEGARYVAGTGAVPANIDSLPSAKALYRGNNGYVLAFGPALRSGR